MRATALFTRTIAACRRGLVLVAALSFVLSGMASIHTAHALSGGHDGMQHDGMQSVSAQAEVGTDHCASQNQPASKAQKDGNFSCCALACAPPLLLNQPPGFALDAPTGTTMLPALQHLILSRDIALPFRPPRSNA